MWTLMVLMLLVPQELFGAVQVSPLSSGYSLGSSNWIIQSHHEKVSYVSGSSLLTTHPQVSCSQTYFSMLEKIKNKKNFKNLCS